MKVLCPIDFSKASVKACDWIARLLNDVEKSEMHLCHFIHFNRRADMFISIDKIFTERAEKDMEELVKDLEFRYPNITISVSIYKSNPKEGIVNIAKRDNYDLIVTGTNGLDALKNMTIGSVTAYVFDNSAVPVLAVPKMASLRKVAKIALAVDDEFLREVEPLTFVRDLSFKLGATLHVAHVTEKGESPFEYDPTIDMIFKKVKFSFDRLEFSNSISETLNTYCDNEEMDLLCMIHRKRNWISKLFHKSAAKSELFNIELPFLVLND